MLFLVKPRVLELSIRRGKSNLSINSSFFVRCEEKDYYHVISVEQLGFDCRLYCGRSHRMQYGSLAIYNLNTSLLTKSCVKVLSSRAFGLEQ